MKLEMSSEAMEIKMEINPGEGYEGDRYGHDLLTRATVQIIEAFDTNFAEKEAEYWDTQQYYAAILSAVARHYMVNGFEEREVSVQDTLAELIQELVTSGMLQEMISSGPYDDDFE